MTESYFLVDKRVTTCTEPSGYQKDKRGRTQFFGNVRYVKTGSVLQTGSGKRKTKKRKSKN